MIYHVGFIRIFFKGEHELVQDVELLGGCVLLQQLGGDLSFGGEHDAIFG